MKRIPIDLMSWHSADAYALYCCILASTLGAGESRDWERGPYGYFRDWELDGRTFSEANQVPRED